MQKEDEGSLRSQASGEVGGELDTLRERVAEHFRKKWDWCVTTPEGLLNRADEAIEALTPELDRLHFLYRSAVERAENLAGTVHELQQKLIESTRAPVSESAPATPGEIDCKADCPATAPECRCVEQAWHRTCCHVTTQPNPSPEASSEASPLIHLVTLSSDTGVMGEWQAFCHGCEQRAKGDLSRVAFWKDQHEADTLVPAKSSNHQANQHVEGRPAASEPPAEKSAAAAASWIEEDRFADFRFALSYARSHFSLAAQAHSKVTREEAYRIYSTIKHGFERLERDRGAQRG